MTSHQPQRPPRRRSARLAFAEDENRAYEEEDDGFRFTRKKSKKEKPAPKPVVESVKRIERVASPPPSQKERQQKPSKRLKTFDTPTAGEELRVPKRRSGRLSGERDTGKGEGHDSRERQENGKRHRNEVPGDEGMVHSVHDAGKSNADSTKIALPFSDTPVINRNKQMRRGSGGHRRSSIGLRGRRASSLIDSGSNAIPHRTVEASEFYKHISSEGLSEPRRMKQLLTWCGTRALGNKPAYSSGTEGHARLAGKAACLSVGALRGTELTAEIARVIQEELLKDLSNRSELSDWFNREDTAPTVLVKKPNPRNISDAAKIQELEKQLQRLQEERAEWESLLAVPEPLPALSPPRITSPAEIDASLLDPEQAAILATLTSMPPIAPLVEKRLDTAANDLEFKVDKFADGVHQLRSWQKQAERVADTILKECATKLEEREKQVIEKAGMKGVDVKEVLRSLSRLER